MITNNKITYYQKRLDNNSKIEKWTRYVFDNVWAFGGKGSSLYKGYIDANDVDIRIPMKYVEDKKLFKVGDIIVIGEHGNIEKQSDLANVEFYNIKSISINDFGNNPHVHLGGK